MTELRRRMIEELRLRNSSPNTVEIYIRCVAKFAQYFKLSPDQLGPEHIRQYQLFLVQRKKVAWAVFNQTVWALRFFYRQVLHQDWMVEHIPVPAARGKTAGRLESCRSCSRMRSYPQAQTPHHPDDHLRRRPASLRAHPPPGVGYR
jgi:hypothetical protein